ncbi:hypothetical protein C2E21_7225 [Chlorella sorokiniana]|uniref:Uncharacterized protein n=1 Tax=Chlorella sorokiniana TaxID=3076 RepID=A0A2P6TI37_CHLSO|nr:hypothetical protein C2E21_7225 [Chlorella sorokiniana]|eukprot:PRW33936.1 hypothetical protein C2E21_7225 [Chlorella sorokiniana]
MLMAAAQVLPRVAKTFLPYSVALAGRVMFADPPPLPADSPLHAPRPVWATRLMICGAALAWLPIGGGAMLCSEYAQYVSCNALAAPAWVDATTKGLLGSGVFAKAMELLGVWPSWAAAHAGIEFKLFLFALPIYACYRVAYYFTSWLLTLPGLSFATNGAPFQLLLRCAAKDTASSSNSAPCLSGPNGAPSVAQTQAAALALRRLVSHMAGVLCHVIALGSWPALLVAVRATFLLMSLFMLAKFLLKWLAARTSH